MKLVLSLKRSEKWVLLERQVGSSVFICWKQKYVWASVLLPCLCHVFPSLICYDSPGPLLPAPLLFKCVFFVIYSLQMALLSTSFSFLFLLCFCLTLFPACTRPLILIIFNMVKPKKTNPTASLPSLTLGLAGFSSKRGNHSSDWIYPALYQLSFCVPSSFSKPFMGFLNLYTRGTHKCIKHAHLLMQIQGKRKM